MTYQSFDEWLKVGYQQGWCGPPVCYTHDGMPASEEEDENIYEAGLDPCMTIIRLYADPEMKRAVESNHSPSVWRAINIGL